MERVDSLFPALLKRARLPQPQPEFRFYPARRWRFDYAWLPQMVALEVEGGAYTRGRHTRGAGFVKDMEKYNTATLVGWRVFRVTPDKLCDLGTIAMLRQALTQTEAA